MTLQSYATPISSMTQQGDLCLVENLGKSSLLESGNAACWSQEMQPDTRQQIVAALYNTVVNLLYIIKSASCCIGSQILRACNVICILRHEQTTPELGA